MSGVDDLLAPRATPPPASTDWVPIWNLGAPAGVPTGALVPIADIVLSSSQPSIDLLNIPQTFSHLMLKIVCRSDAPSGNTTLLLRFNGDSGANYDRELLFASAAATGAQEQLGATSMDVGWGSIIPTASAPAGRYAMFDVSIPSYVSALVSKTVRAVGGNSFSTASGATYVSDYFGFWRSTAPINRITLTLGAGNLVAGTQVTLYGMLGTLPTTVAPPVTAAVPATTLPGSPVDGQQAILVDSTSAPTFSWLLQWSAVAAKWIAIGPGTPLGNELLTSNALANAGTTAYVALPTATPTITIPRSGRYDLTFGAQLQGGAVNVALNSANLTPNDADSLSVSQSTGMFAYCSRTLYNRQCAAGDVVTLRYKGNLSGWAIPNCSIAAIPIWVT
jgi:hypothetical protein